MPDAAPRPGPSATGRGPFAPADRPVVDVRHRDGRRYRGRLHGWVRGDGGWRAVVTYTTGPGLQFYACVPADDVRPLPEGAPAAPRAEVRRVAERSSHRRGVPDGGVS